MQHLYALHHQAGQPDDHVREKQSRSVDGRVHDHLGIYDGLTESPEPGLAEVTPEVLPKRQA